jgi:hypothetical protein
MARPFTTRWRSRAGQDKTAVFYAPSPACWVRIRFSQDHAAISTRLRTPSLFWMRAMCVLTVLREMNSSAAISWLVRPVGTLGM